MRIIYIMLIVIAFLATVTVLATLFNRLDINEIKSEASNTSIRFVKADIVQKIRGGIVVTDEAGVEYYIEFDRWLSKTDWGEDFYSDTPPLGHKY